MITYNEAKMIAAAQSPNGVPVEVKPQVKWVAYKNGAVVGESFFSAADARLKFNTSLVEPVALNATLLTGKVMV